MKDGQKQGFGGGGGRGQGSGRGQGGRGQGQGRGMRLQRRDGSGCGSSVDNTVPRSGLPAGTEPAIEASAGPASQTRPIVRVTDAETCTLCGSCVDACMRGAISVNDTVAIDARLCTGCGDCIEACPQGVLELVEV